MLAGLSTDDLKYYTGWTEADLVKNWQSAKQFLEQS